MSVGTGAAGSTSSTVTLFPLLSRFQRSPASWAAASHASVLRQLARLGASGDNIFSEASAVVRRVPNNGARPCADRYRTFSYESTKAPAAAKSFDFAMLDVDDIPFDSLSRTLASPTAQDLTRVFLA